MVQIISNDAAASEHFDVVKGKIATRIKNVLKGGIRDEHGNKIVLAADLRMYLNSLTVETNLKALIVASPIALKGIISYFIRHNPNFVDTNHESNFVLKNIFIDNCYKQLDKLEFIKRFALDTCPYCNRNYIYYTSEKNKIKPQLDHFYPQTKYPVLGICFYNLIPSCQTCNGLDVKSSIDTYKRGLLNPYLLTKDSFKFSYDIKNIDVMNPLLNNDSIEIKFVNKLQSHLDVFKLDKLYQQHADHVLELVIKSKLKYSSSYRAYLKNYKELRFSDKEIDRLILGNYTEDDEIHKRPLAKLYQDIGKELGLII